MKIEFSNCNVDGNKKHISLIDIKSSGNYNPSDSFFGVNNLIIKNCTFANIYSSSGRFIWLRDVGCKNFICENNEVHNFFPRIIDISTSNDHPYSTDIYNSHYNFIIKNNYIHCDDDYHPNLLYPTFNPTYYTFAVIEGKEALFENNRIEGVHYIKTGDIEPALYDSYLTCDRVIYRNNHYKNIMLFAENKDYCDIFKSKNGGYKIYEGNKVINEESYYDKLGVGNYNIPKNAYTMGNTLFGYQSVVDNVIFTNNYIDCYSINIHYSYLSYVKNLKMTNNTIISRKYSNMIVLSVINENTNNITISNNYIEISDNQNTYDKSKSFVLAEFGGNGVDTSAIITIDNNTFVIDNMTYLVSERETTHTNHENTNIYITNNKFPKTIDVQYGIFPRSNIGRYIFKHNEFLGNTNETKSLRPLFSNREGVERSKLPDFVDSEFTLINWKPNERLIWGFPNYIDLVEGDKYKVVFEFDNSLLGKYLNEFELEVVNKNNKNVLSMNANIAWVTSANVNDNTVYNLENYIFDGSASTLNQNVTIQNIYKEYKDIYSSIYNYGDSKGIYFLLLGDTSPKFTNIKMKLFKI